jgi:predicted RNase H-like HicB family nuclease
MNFTIECEQETDGRWLAEVPQLPGVMCYGRDSDDAITKVEVLALRAMAERIDARESRPTSIHLSMPLAA